MTNRTRYAVLGALSQHPMSGYDVRRSLETIVGHFWHESFGQIYPILRQLVAEGLATVDKEKTAGRPERYVYTVTPEGRAELDRWLAMPVAKHQRPRHELLLKLFFGSNVPLDVTLDLVARHREELQSLLGTYGRIEAELGDPSLVDDPGRPFWLATLRYGELSAQAALRWCEETTAELRGLATVAGQAPTDGTPPPADTGR